MIGAYGDTSRSHSQTRKPQLGTSALRPVPALATEFELHVSQLHLTPEMYASSAKLRTWCERNRNRCYVPEWLLKEWDITVDPSSAA